MTIEERKAEIIGTNGIEASELVHEYGHMFKSIEYYMIIHMTNAELYYADDMALCWYANEHIDTDKGKIFYFT
jgi:hypothetical protein